MKRFTHTVVTSSLQDLLSIKKFLTEASGEELIIYSGEYLVSDISLHSNVKVYGFGRTVLKLSDGEAVSGLLIRLWRELL